VSSVQNTRSEANSKKSAFRNTSVKLTLGIKQFLHNIAHYFCGSLSLQTLCLK